MPHPPQPLWWREHCRRFFEPLNSFVMNDANVEHLLRSLRPAAPSAELTQRVERDLKLAALFREAAPASVAAKPRRTLWQSHLTWAAIGAAAAVLVMSVMPARTGLQTGSELASQSQTAEAPLTDRLLPVSSTREWVDLEDGGISFATPDSPQRQMRVHSLERHQWIDPRDGAEYTVEVPTVESVVLPVKYQ